MKDLLEYIVKNLVSNPDAVSVDEQRDGTQVNLNLTVDGADMGLIIGKGGQTIHAIRKLLTVRAISENVRVNLQLTEPDGSLRPQRTEESAETQSEEHTEDTDSSAEETTSEEPKEQ